jgi:hypothetical protein
MRLATTDWNMKSARHERDTVPYWQFSKHSREAFRLTDAGELPFFEPPVGALSSRPRSIIAASYNSPGEARRKAGITYYTVLLTVVGQLAAADAAGFQHDRVQRHTTTA